MFDTVYLVCKSVSCLYNTPINGARGPLDPNPKSSPKISGTLQSVQDKQAGSPLRGYPSAPPGCPGKSIQERQAGTRASRRLRRSRAKAFC